MKNISDLRGTTDTENQIEEENVRRLNIGHIPDNEILYNLPLFLSSKLLSRILFFNEMYKKILIIMELLWNLVSDEGDNELVSVIERNLRTI